MHQILEMLGNWLNFHTYPNHAYRTGCFIFQDVYNVCVYKNRPNSVKKNYMQVQKSVSPELI